MGNKGQNKLYVVTAPKQIKGIYPTWEACKAAVSGVTGARYQKVSNREEAEALLSGEGTTLAPGLYAFVDGNHRGGVGLVFVEQREDGTQTTRESSRSVQEIFATANIPTLQSKAAIEGSLASLRNILAELGGLYGALRDIPTGSTLTIVYDYEGIAAWIEGRWRAKDKTVAEIIAACRVLIDEKRLTLSFRHQRGHMSTFAGRNDFAKFNARADKLAQESASSSQAN